MAYLVGIGEHAAEPDAGPSASALAFAARASLNALADGGIDRTRVDGVLTYGLFGDFVPAEAIGTALGRSSLRVAMDFNLGGQAPALLIAQAARLVDSGQAEAVLVVRALRGRSGVRVGSARFPRFGEDERRAAGVSAYPITAALWGRGYLHGTGHPAHVLSEALFHAKETAWPGGNSTSDQPANFHPRALPADLTAYLASPLVADPLRKADCVSEVDGAACVLVVGEALSEESRQPRLEIGHSAWRSVQADVDMGSVIGVDDLSRNVAWHLAADLRERADVDAREVDVVSLYDCFSSVLIQNIEGIGLCGYGEGPAYLAERRRYLSEPPPTSPSRPWLNPGGGMLSRGYVHGLNNAVDAVRALRLLQKQSSSREVRGLIVSGGMTSGSAVTMYARAA